MRLTVPVLLCLPFVGLAVPPPPAPEPDPSVFVRALESEAPVRPIEVRGEPWLKDRISRCFFGPIGRPPFNRDELGDDVDYYPEAYLRRLAAEGVNGLWISCEWRQLDARHFEKLRRTVAKCAKFGIRVWLFGNEPRSVRPGEDRSVFERHPDWGGCISPRSKWQVWCASSPGVLDYIRSTMKRIFTEVPGLGGFLDIVKGEGLTTCFDHFSPYYDDPSPGCLNCPRCKARQPGDLFHDVTKAMADGIRAAGSQAPVVAWVYEPYEVPRRKDWVYDLPRHVPEGVTLQYNFESGSSALQLGKPRAAGDYWLSLPGPGEPFRQLAATAKSVGIGLSAKTQVSTSWELATVPYVPVPGLLYRKFRAMRECGVVRAMYSWYFGSNPGLMNRAAGLLAYEDFKTDEDDFLRRLAASAGCADVQKAVARWKSYADGYANYPVATAMQYCGPFHAGSVWRLQPLVQMGSLGYACDARVSCEGDVLGDCLPNHTIDEALELTGRMERGFACAEEDPDDVARAVLWQVRAAKEIFAFYSHRASAIWQSRTKGDVAAARREIAAMRDCVVRSRRPTEELLKLSEGNPYLGFHSEAETHLYFPERLKWRLRTLDETDAELVRLDALLAAGGTYPLSETERSYGTLAAGPEQAEGRVTYRLERREDGGLVVNGCCAADVESVTIGVFDTAAIAPIRSRKVRRGEASGNWSFREVFEVPDGDRRLDAAYFALRPDHRPSQFYGNGDKTLWRRIVDSDRKGERK